MCRRSRALTPGAGQSMACAMARTGATLTQGFFSWAGVFEGAVFRRAAAGVDCAVRASARPAQLTARSAPAWTGATGIPLRADRRLRALRDLRFSLRGGGTGPRGGGLKLGRGASPDRSARHAHLCAKFGKLFL